MTICLKEEYDAYIARLETSGVPLVPYTVPCCGGALKSRLAPAGTTWDSLHTCPYCGALGWKVTTGETLTVTIPEDL